MQSCVTNRSHLHFPFAVVSFKSSFWIGNRKLERENIKLKRYLKENSFNTSRLRGQSLIREVRGTALKLKTDAVVVLLRKNLNQWYLGNYSIGTSLAGNRLLSVTG